MDHNTLPPSPEIARTFALFALEDQRVSLFLALNHRILVKPIFPTQPYYRCRRCIALNEECNFNGWGRDCIACESRHHGDCDYRSLHWFLRHKNSYAWDAEGTSFLAPWFKLSLTEVSRSSGPVREEPNPLRPS
jgi:hypothetical protein